MKIEKNKFVLMHYTLKDDQGKIIDSSVGKDPLEFIHGNGMIIPGLEQVLIGKAKGDKFTTVIPAEEGYGEKRSDLIQNVSLHQFDNPDQVQVGSQFQANGPQQAIATVIAREADHVIVDMNHPLAGQELYFDIDVFDVRDLSEKEMEAMLGIDSCTAEKSADGECGCC